MKKYLLPAALCMATAITANAQTAQVQVIHNSADAAAAQVDVYLGSTKILDDFAFRTASSFLNVAAGTPQTISVAPSNSTSVNDAIFNTTATFMANTNYVVVANGIVSTMGYTPAQPFGLDVYGMAQQQSAGGVTEVDVLVMHGSTDAPAVDVRSGVETLIDDIAYGDFSNGYLTLPAADLTARVTNTTGSATVETYAAPLVTLGLGGEALVVVASGFLNPANNSNGPGFGLYAALPAGGPLVALPTADAEALARVQVIHNCADMAADSVDVYLNGDLVLDNFSFRTATEFVDLFAKTQLEIGVAPKNSTSVADTIYNLSTTLDSAGTYILVANGIVSSMGYTPSQPFRLSVYANAREVATNMANTDVLVMHGSTDAPTVDVRSGSTVLVDDIMFGDFASTGYLQLPLNNYILDITDGPGTNVVAKYSAPIQTLGLGGASITVLASGFLNPANNSNGPGFGLYAATADGGNLIPLPVVTSVGNIYGNGASFTVWPVPANDVLHIEGDISEQAEIEVYDVAGRQVLRANNVRKVDISTLNSGIYILSVNDSGLKGQVKFVKQ